MRLKSCDFKGAKFESNMNIEPQPYHVSWDILILIFLYVGIKNTWRMGICGKVTSGAVNTLRVKNNMLCNIMKSTVIVQHKQCGTWGIPAPSYSANGWTRLTQVVNVVVLRAGQCYNTHKK